MATMALMGYRGLGSGSVLQRYAAQATKDEQPKGKPIPLPNDDGLAAPLPKK